MSVSLSIFGGAGWQFFDDNGDPLSGGKVYTYIAGTTTPQTTYTSSTGNTPHTNPIVLDAAGRVPGGEIWLTDPAEYKFTIRTSDDTLIGTYDNVLSVGSNIASGIYAFYAAPAGAANVGVTPFSLFSATNVQDAIEELDGDKISFSRLNDADGATLIGTTDGSTVQAAINARPTSSNLASFSGAALVGTSTYGTVQNALDSLFGGQTAGVLGYATRAALFADLSPPDQSVAYVLNDPTVAYNGIYRKSGAAGTGSWIVETNSSAIQGQDVNFSGLANSLYTVLSFVPGGQYLGGGVVTGAFKIKFPVNKTSTYLTMDIRIMDQFGQLSIQVSGANQNPTWQYTTAFCSLQNSINPSPTVRFGYDGTSACIWIGDVSSTWTFPQVWIDKVTLGLFGYNSSWLSPWAISLVNSFDTVDAVKDPLPVTSSDIPRQYSPANATFNGGVSDTTGAFKIRLPVRNTSSFVTFVVKIMDVYGIREYLISGSNSSVWNYPRALVNGKGTVNMEVPVRWGNDGAYDCVWIGDTTTTNWAFPSVWVTDLEVGGFGSTNATWLNNWEISLVTTFDTVTAGPITPTLPLVANETINGGVVSFPSSTGSAISTYLGYQAGINSVGAGLFNTFVGYQCGYANTTGYNNCYGGLQTGAANTTGYANSGWGLQVMQVATTAAFNSGFGIHALLGLTTGLSNTAVGGGSMQSLASGDNNTAIGMYAGRDVTGSNNVFIGNRAGQGNTAINNRLYIANNATTTLIYGEFDNEKVVIDGTLTTDQYILSDLNTAPANASATGTKGEIRVTSNYIYVCTATNTWVRAGLSTW
jgi:hypothetical protein